jgi:hypothetical protein
VESVEAAHVVPPKIWLISPDGVLNTAGTKLVANVLSHMKVEETPTLCSSTPTELLMSDSGKSTNQTGAHAAEEKPHAIYNPT